MIRFSQVNCTIAVANLQPAEQQEKNPTVSGETFFLAGLD